MLRCAGLVYMHAHNPPLIHRDLKSLNILVDENWKGKVRFRLRRALSPAVLLSGSVIACAARLPISA